MSVELEKNIIGCLLMGREAECVNLTQEDFTENRKLYIRAIQHLFKQGEPIEVMTVSNLASKAKQCKNALSELTEYACNITMPDNIKFYISELQKSVAIRTATQKAKALEAELSKNLFEDSQEIKTFVTEYMNIEVKEKQEDASLDAVIDNFMTMLEKKAAGKIKEIKTGIFDLDNLTGGLHGGEITIIAARPSVGKTAFAMALIQKIAFDFPCLMFNLEMSKEQLMSRMVSAIGNINSARLRNPKFLDDNENKDINRAISYIGDKLKLKLYDNVYTVEKIRTITREQKPDVIFIDYLTLCSSIRRHESKRQEIEYISREFKKMSKEFNIPVVVLSQLNRANEKDNREPQLYDLRETGAIEQDADNVIMLHGKMNDFGEYEPELKLLVRKQRNGAIGCVKVLFDRARYQFKNMAR